MCMWTRRCHSVACCSLLQPALSTISAARLDVTDVFLHDTLKWSKNKDTKVYKHLNEGDDNMAENKKTAL